MARTLHLMQASMQTDSTVEQWKDDMRFQLDKEPDLVFMTEAKDHHGAIRELLANRPNYRPVFLPGYKFEAFYIRHDEHLKLKDRGSKHVHPRDLRMQPRKYPRRSICWVQVKWYDWNIYFHGAHWITGYSATEQRDERHERTTQMMCDLVKKHGNRPNSLSFFAGDQNVDEAKDNRKTAIRSQIDGTFRQNGLLTIWDEMEVTPTTHGHGENGPTIDIIGSYTPDKQVKAKRWKVWPKQNSDHRFVSAWYEIGAVPKSGGGGGKNDPTPKKKPGFITGGKINFSDYRDGSVYPLPYAIDDSDLTNG